MTLKNMNFISYIYISTLLCVPLVDLLKNELDWRKRYVAWIVTS